MATKKTAGSKTAKPAAKKVSTTVKAAAETVEPVQKVEAPVPAETVKAPEAKADNSAADMAQAFFPEFAKLTEGFGDFAAIGQANFDAYVKSAERFSKGMEDLNRHWSTYTQALVDDAVSVGQELATCSSVEEVVEVQNTYSQKTLDGLVAETSRMSEISITVANETIEPLKAQFDATVATINKSVAA